MKGITPKLFRSYLIIVLSIVLFAVAGQWVIHAHLKDFEKDGVRINLAGKQRMISQQIVKNLALVALGVEDYTKDWKDLIEGFENVHHAIESGDESLDLPMLTDAELLRQYEITDEKFQHFIQQLPDSLNTELSKAQLLKISLAQEKFLVEMDRLVFASTENMQAKVSNFQVIEFSIAICSFLLILIELLVVFIPAMKTISEQNNKLIKTAFYYSHIFRKPVANILALLNLTDREGKLSDKQAKNIGLIRKEGQNLDSIIRKRVKEIEKI